MVHGAGDVPQLRRFIDDSDAGQGQKQVEHGKLDALIGFTEASECRRQVLLRHFGEVLAQPCGNCDHCLEPDRSVELTEPCRKALSGVFRTGQRFGAAHVIDVLLGADTARIRELGHASLSVYGIGKELDRGQWKALFRQLVARGYLVSDSEARGGLRFGDETLVRPLLRGEVSLALRLPPPGKERRRAAPGERQPSAAGTELGEAGQRRFEALRSWRLEQAREQGVPPYVVFHDRTLIEIASREPVNLEELGGVAGVGQAKLARYGEAVLAALRSLESNA
jgi:ATP-dependent DNA helicase RecQ